MRSHREIEEILSTEIKRARQRQQDARKQFREITGDIPSLIPAPDGALRIQQAGAEYRGALEDLRNAMTRFNDFLVNGVVPEDLRIRRIR
jgi:hypothetical protein